MADWTQEDTQRYLNDAELFSDIPKEDRARLAVAGRARSIPANELVFKRGDTGDSLFVIAAGQVSITLELPAGAEEVSTLQQGDFFGEIAMMTRAHRTATVTSLQPTTLIEFAARDILPLIDRCPKFKERIARTGALRSRESLEKMIKE